MHSGKEGVLVAIHSVGRVCRGMHPCGVRSHVLGWVVWRASLKHPFLLKSSSIFEGLQGVFLKFLMPLIFRIVFAGIELIFLLCSALTCGEYSCDCARMRLIAE